MAQTRIDELNTLGNKNSSDVFDREEFINHYFDTMQITERQKEERIDAAKDLFDAILLFLIWCENAPERVQEEDTLRSFENMYKEVVFQHGEPDEYFDNYVHSFIPSLIKTTLEHVGEEYFTSVERAANVACNEANSVVNYTELQQAIEDGYTYKKWCTELDLRVRPTHQMMEGVTIPINEPFQVGQYLMMQPHDMTLGAGAEEIVNCRCSLLFKDNYVDLDLQFFSNKSKHAAYRQNQRKISDEDIQDALDNPLDDPYNYFEEDDKGGTIKYIGRNATVIVNAETDEHVTYYKTASKTVRNLENGI